MFAFQALCLTPSFFLWLLSPTLDIGCLCLWPWEGVVLSRRWEVPQPLPPSEGRVGGAGITTWRDHGRGVWPVGAQTPTARACWTVVQSEKQIKVPSAQWPSGEDQVTTTSQWLWSTTHTTPFMTVRGAGTGVWKEQPPWKWLHWHLRNQWIDQRITKTYSCFVSSVCSFHFMV